MTKDIRQFSNNIFDLNTISKKEYVEMIDYFIQSVYLLKNIDTKNNEINSNTINRLNDFGIILDDNTDILKKKIGEELFYKLIIAINNLDDINIVDYPELEKFHFKNRVKISKQENKSNKPTLVDLFCGAGGLSLGLVQSGFRIIFANDIEQSALRTYNFNHPEVDGRYITKGGIENIVSNIHTYIKEDVDVIAGGPPCQGFSNANRQRIIDDPRNILYKYYIDITHQLKPKFIIMENVKGMLKVADQVVEDFNSSTDIYYDISYKIINAKNIGVPQNRERLIYIGIRNDISKQMNITAMDLIESIDDSRDNDDFVPIIDAIDDLRRVNASRKKNSTKGDSESGYIIELNTNNTSNKYLDVINNNKISKFIFNHKARYNNDRDIEIFGRMIPGDKSDSPRIADIMPYGNRNHIFKDKYFKLIPNVPSKTITAHMKYDCNMYIHPYQARGLTPREAARVQSFPDNYFFLGSYTKTYQQIGNSVPPLMAKIIGEKLINYITKN